MIKLLGCSQVAKVFKIMHTKTCRPLHTRCHDTVQVYVVLLERIVVNHMIAS